MRTTPFWTLVATVGPVYSWIKVCSGDHTITLSDSKKIIHDDIIKLGFTQPIRYITSAIPSETADTQQLSLQ